MTTEELEKKLKISKNTCIHCPTLELAKQVLSIFHQLDLKWCSGEYYTLDHNWNAFKGNTLYHPFEGECSSLGYDAHLKGYKIINAEEFIALHTKFDLENYEPKGQLKDFPKEIIARMLKCQVEQWNKRDVYVFEKDKTAGGTTKGIVWGETKEGYDFWNEVIRYKKFDLFFEKYPKKQEYQELKNNKKEKEPQKFRVGDKIIDIILDLKGEIINIKSNGNLEIKFEGKRCLTEYNLKIEKRTSLLHYRDDYNYDVIDFNNLPERQEPKRWRAKKGGVYYSFTSNFGIEESTEDNYYLDNEAYDSGNYFQKREEAQEVADKLSKYFQELINKSF